VITRAEFDPVMILVLKGLANAKLAAARITSAIEQRTAKIFMVKKYTLFPSWPTRIVFTRLQHHSTVAGPSKL
jgi:hypothetical protein